MPRIIRLDRPASEAVPLAPDSDFDDDDSAPPPPKKRAKSASRSPVGHQCAKVSRIDACGVTNLDRTVLAVRDAVPDAVVILCCLSRDIADQSEAHQVDDTFVPLSRDGSAYHVVCDDDDLSEPEFMGLFASGPYDRAYPGVCDDIIARLDADPLNHVIVVDPSVRGVNLARLAAGVAALKWCMALRPGPDQALRKAQVSALLKPTDAKWKAALARCARGQTWGHVRERARDWFLDT